MPFLTKLCKVSVFVDQAMSGKCGMPWHLWSHGLSVWGSKHFRNGFLYVSLWLL